MQFGFSNLQTAAMFVLVGFSSGFFAPVGMMCESETQTIDLAQPLLWDFYFTAFKALDSSET